MKYPAGIQTFEQIIQDGYVYVDKTELIYNLVDNGKIYFLGRPRRFGKSLLVSTLKNYFLGKKELFKGLAIEKLETKWAEHAVFHFDFGQEDYSQDGVLEQKLETCVADWEKIYGESPYPYSVGSRFAHVLEQAREKTGRRCVVLVDNCDKPILDALGTDIRTAENRLLSDKNHSVLDSFFSVFKSSDGDLQFVFLTGVVRFAPNTPFSGFNSPNDISLDARYEPLCGFTQEEVEKYFSGPIQELAEKYQCTVAEMFDKLKQQYGGYHFGRKMVDVYNPFSLLNALENKEISNYCTQPGMPAYLERTLSNTQYDLGEITKYCCNSGHFSICYADYDNTVAMLYQSGYLTIKTCELTPSFNHVYTLDIPNDEIKSVFHL